MRFIELLIEQSTCPLRDIYGGMLPGGGYKSYTEYEIGAQRIAEALHCILGSLSKDFGRYESNPDEFKSFETGHIKEEMGLIEKDIDEYCNVIYTKMLKGRMYSEDSVKSMKKVSPRLIKMAKQAKKKLKKEDMPIEMYNVADSSYATLIELGKSVLAALKKEPYRNAFLNPRLRKEVAKLRKHVDVYVTKLKKNVAVYVTKWKN
jgi:hypothetical protein